MSKTPIGEALFPTYDGRWYHAAGVPQRKFWLSRTNLAGFTGGRGAARRAGASAPRRVARIADARSSSRPTPAARQDTLQQPGKRRLPKKLLATQYNPLLRSAACAARMNGAQQTR
jgi:hypothetical protein